MTTDITKQQYKNMHEAKRLLNKHRLVAVGQRVSDFLHLLRSTHLEALIICEYEPRAIEYWKDTITISPEISNLLRRAWNNSSLGSLCEISNKIISQLEFMEESPINIIPYAASSEWEQWANATSGGFYVIGPLAKIKKLIDNKINTRSALRDRGLPVPVSTTMLNSVLNFDLLSKSLGAPFVIQKPVSSSGKGTFIISKEEELQRIKSSENVNLWLASSYVGSTTLNVHGLALPNKFQVSLPSVQITGVEGISTGWGAYCGNDFGAAQLICPNMRKSINHLVEEVGIWLLEQGYEGVFGVDIIVNENEAYIVEVNPRFQGSTWLLSEIENELGLVPLAMKHILWHLGEQINFFPTNSELTMHATYLIIHSLSDKLARYQHRMRAGAYTLDRRNRLCWQHECIGLDELKDDEILIFGLPSNNKGIVEPGSAIARIASRQSLAYVDGRSLNEMGQRIVDAVKHELDICVIN